MWVVFVLCVSAAGALNAQRPFAMKYLDEVGHLGGPDKRATANLGLARVFVEPEGGLRFEGHDRTGKLWRVWLPPGSGAGGVDVWTADFDRNGHPDLLISANFPGSGRCIDGGMIYTLMFDELGRPVPWVSYSNSLAGMKRPPVPIVDVNGDGRAELVTVSCQYSGQTGFAEDRQVSGIYEARDARWIPMRQTPERPYLAAAKRQHGETAQGWVRWLPSDPAHWPDFLAGYDSPPTARMRSLISGEIGCGGIRLSVVGGSVIEPKDDPCDSLRYGRVVYSDGPPRRGWPDVVIESSDGRKVFLSNADQPLLSVLKMGYRFRILGDPAAPALLWVEGGTGANPAPVSARLRTRQPELTKLVVNPQRTAGSDMLDITFSLGRRCFVLRRHEGQPIQMTESRNCPAITNLATANVDEGPIRVRESTAWQILSARNAVRTFRSDDGGELGTIAFQSPPGISGVVAAAVPFEDGWLVEWHSGPRRWLMLHSETGKALTTKMSLPVDGELLASRNDDGIQFLKWENGKPAELIIVRASVEWFRTPE